MMSVYRLLQTILIFSQLSLTKHQHLKRLAVADIFVSQCYWNVIPLFQT